MRSTRSSTRPSTLSRPRSTCLSSWTSFAARATSLAAFAVTFEASLPKLSTASPTASPARSAASAANCWTASIASAAASRMSFTWSRFMRSFAIRPNWFDAPLGADALEDGHGSLRSVGVSTLPVAAFRRGRCVAVRGCRECCSVADRALIVGCNAVRRDAEPRSMTSPHDSRMPAKDELPGTLQRSPKKAQETWSKTHDAAVETYGEGERAHRTAFASLKHSFEKVGDHWVAKDEPGPSDPDAARGDRPAAPARDVRRRGRGRAHARGAVRARDGARCPRPIADDEGGARPRDRAHAGLGPGSIAAALDPDRRAATLLERPAPQPERCGAAWHARRSGCGLGARWNGTRSTWRRTALLGTRAVPRERAHG